MSGKRIGFFLGVSVISFLIVFPVIRAPRVYVGSAIIEMHPYMSWHYRITKKIPVTTATSLREAMTSDKYLGSMVEDLTLTSKWKQSRKAACHTIRERLTIERTPDANQFLVEFTNVDSELAEEVMQSIVGSFQEWRLAQELVRSKRHLGLLQDKLRWQSEQCEKALKNVAETEGDALAHAHAHREYAQHKKVLARMQATFATDTVLDHWPDVPLTMRQQKGQWKKSRFFRW